MEKNIGEAHIEFLTFMLKNHDLSKFSTFDKYIEYQYDYLITQYPELSEYAKKDFVNLVLSILNSNNIDEFSYTKSLDISLKSAYEAKVISDNFYSETTHILNDESEDGTTIEERIGAIEATNEFEKDAISYFLEVAKSSKEFWEHNIVIAKRNWVVWGADAWGGAVAGIGAGFLSANPLVGYLAGLAGSELMSAAVAAVQGPRP